MTDPAEIARGLTKAQRDVLRRVCATSGGGLSIRCKVGDDGYGVPLHGPTRKLWEKHLIQGKSGGYEKVVHTRKGWAVFKYCAKALKRGYHVRVKETS